MFYNGLNVVCSISTVIITSGLDKGVKTNYFSEMYRTFNLYALSIKFKDYEAAQICENVRISPVCTYISIYVRNTEVIKIWLN